MACPNSDNNNTNNYTITSSNTNNTDNVTCVNKKGPLLGHRHVQAVLLFSAIVVNFMPKFNASIAVVAMTNAESTNPDFEEYDWDEKQKSYILSSFYWGYLISQFPSGYISRRFGVKRTLFTSTLLSAILALLPPFCVPWGGWQVYCALRMFQGIAQGPLFACVYGHLAAWSPVKERNRLGAFANTGIECGIVLSMYLSGVISVSSMGWPGIFYVSGAMGLVWCVVWLLWGANCPTKSKFISQVECVYIISSKHGDKDMLEIVPVRKIPVPWRAIFSSTPFWALLIARAGEAWGFSTIQAEIPTYLHGVFDMDMKQNSLFSALPYLAMWCMSYVFLITSDILLSRKVLSLTAIRKTFNSIAFWYPAISLIAVGFMDASQQTCAIVLMTTTVGFNASGTIGSLLNVIDLSPNHAGILTCLINFVQGIMTMTTPLVVSAIVQDESDRSEWQIVFGISAVVFFITNLIFITFGSTKLQKWDHVSFMKSETSLAEANESCSQTDKSNKF